MLKIHTLILEAGDCAGTAVPGPIEGSMSGKLYSSVMISKVTIIALVHFIVWTAWKYDENVTQSTQPSKLALTTITYIYRNT